MAGTPFRQREDSCCHNCPDHKPIAFSPDGKPITCRQGCIRWAAHEQKMAKRHEERNLYYQGTPDQCNMEKHLRKKMRDMRDGRRRG